VHEIKPGFRRKAGYWNIKGWGHFVAFVSVNYLSFRLFGEGYFEQIVAPLRHHSRKGRFCE
jgi:hypothetical protein